LRQFAELYTVYNRIAVEQATVLLPAKPAAKQELQALEKFVLASKDEKKDVLATKLPALDAAVNHAGPTLVNVISQPLHEARAPVSEWVA
jgi:hypothetical protein